MMQPSQAGPRIDGLVVKEQIMNRGRKWMFLVPISLVGVGLVVMSGIPTRGGSDASSKPASTADGSDRVLDLSDSSTGWQTLPSSSKEPKRLHSSKATRLRTALATSADGAGRPRIVRTAAQLPGLGLDDPPQEVNGIPAAGPDAGKTVNPEQPLPEYRKSVGAQDASLTVDWVTPESIVLLKQGKFDLVLRNRGLITIEQISITNVLPDGFRFVKCDPLPTSEKPRRIWIVKKLAPQEEARISLYLVPTAVGDAKSHARVDFHVASTSSFKVVEPKLKIAVEGSDKVLVGNQAVFNVSIKNPGSGHATGVRMKAFLPDGLEAVAAGTVYDLGTLNPGEARSVRVLARVKALGLHHVKFVGIADDNLRDEAKKDVTGLQAKLDVAISGPKFRYLARPAKYKVVVTNNGNAVARNVNLQVNVPQAFAYLSGGEKGRFDASTKTVHWTIGTLGIGKQASAEFQLKAVNRGNFPLLAEATGDRGLKANVKHVTRVDGIAAILLEVVDVDDPIEVGATTYYEILVTNQGTEFATNIKIAAKVPDGVQILDSKGPSEGKIVGNKITFAPLPKLAPRADAIYRVRVRMLKAGDIRVEATAMADSLESPVKELESTKVYKDNE
jgi:Domain of unknown function DUF11